MPPEYAVKPIIPEDLINTGYQAEIKFVIDNFTSGGDGRNRQPGT